MGEYILRIATANDAQQVLNIYSYYVENTAVSFEYHVPAIDEFSNRIEKTLEKYPYIVCEYKGAVVGYAYASDFRTRTAYQYSTELSVYVEKEHQGKKIASALYCALIAMLSNMGYRNVYGVVTAPNEASEFLHAKFGFKSAGTWLNVGYKNGKWLSVNVFEKQINLYMQDPKGTKAFNKLTQAEISDFLEKAQLLLK